jgi:hypothetical protein
MGEGGGGAAPGEGGGSAAPGGGARVAPGRGQSSDSWMSDGAWLVEVTSVVVLIRSKRALIIFFQVSDQPHPSIHSELALHLLK